MNRPAPPQVEQVEREPVRSPHGAGGRPGGSRSPTAPAPAAQSATEPLSAAEKGEKPGKTPKITSYQHPDDSARMRGAIVAYMRKVGMTNVSRFANKAIMEKVERLEGQYNDGKPFEPVGTGVLTVGRPMGSDMATPTAAAVIVKAFTVDTEGVELTRHYGPFLPHVGSATTTFLEHLEDELRESGRYRDWELSMEDVFIGVDESDCEVRATR